ncbi:MAG TPA: hypothetical protein DCL44_06675 [Elusimicrobia bacterium]|nr:hypothetical protein [Elusimicrobiota bacterium]
MNRKLVFLTMVSAMLAIPAVYAAAQDRPEPAPEGMDEVWQKPPHPGSGGGDMEMKGKNGPGMRLRGEIGEGKRGMGAGFVSGEEAIIIIKKHDPQFAALLEDLKNTAPAKYRMAIGMAGKFLVMAKMENDENLAKDAVRGLSLEYATRELSRSYEKAADQDKAKIKADIKVKTAELFDLRQKEQSMRIQHMEKEVAKLKAKLESRKNNKAKIVDQRVEELTGEGSGW